MAKEIDWQAKFVKTAKTQGKYARKASSTYAVGVHDIHYISNALGFLSLEMKLVKRLGSTFSRQMDFSERQKDEGAMINLHGNPMARACGIMVFHYNPSKVHMCLVKMPNVGQTVSVTNEDVNVTNNWKTIKEDIDGWLTAELQRVGL